MPRRVDYRLDHGPLPKSILGLRPDEERFANDLPQLIVPSSELDLQLYESTAHSSRMTLTR